jgi:dTDP-4-dehydrorhamnose 3,5-epimerase
VKFIETELSGAFVIELERHPDERGFFARSFCQNEFGEHGLATAFVQSNVSFNEHGGTLRGMHYQVEPHREAKLVRCTAGALYDVIIDFRSDSPTRFSWVGVELSAENRRMLYVPEGFAHGFVTLEPATEVFYEMSSFHQPDAARGLRWNDPYFAIEWPRPAEVISERDASYSDFDPDADAEGNRG